MGMIVMMVPVMMQYKKRVPLYWMKHLSTTMLERTVVVNVVAGVVEDVEEIEWFVLIPNNKIDKLRVTGLREALGSRGLSTVGKKSDLQVRLKDVIEL
jgi:SAP domain